MDTLAETDLTECQKTAITEFKKFIFGATEKEFILTGSAGSGKTTLIGNFVNILKEHNEMVDLGVSNKKIQQIYLMAPTHKAAKVLADKTGMPVSTIHSALSLTILYNKDTGKPFFVQKKGKPTIIPAGALVIVDESSMIDEELLGHIESLVPSSCTFLYLGDSYQLNPVGSITTPIFDKKVRAIELKELTRANNENIKTLVEQLRDAVITNQLPKLKQTGNIQLMNKTDFENEILVTFNRGDSAKVLAWRNVTVKKYNKMIHTTLNGSEDYFPGQQLVVNKTFRSTGGALLNVEQPLVVRSVELPESVRVGQELIEYTPITLETNQVIRIPANKSQVNRAAKVFKEDKNWYQFYETKEMFADVNDAYALSVHKSQGSSYETVFVDLADIMRNKNYNEMLRLLYVALSRASDRIVLYGG